MNTYLLEQGYLTAAYIASQKPSRQCSCRIEPHRNLHCMPGSGQSKGSSLHLKAFSNMHQLTPSLCLTEHESEREAETGRIKRRMVEEKGVKKKIHKKPWQGPLVELWHREHPVCGVTGWSPPRHCSKSQHWNVPPANWSGMGTLDQEVGRAVGDPVARCSCWLLHRIYTAYWATDSSHRAVNREDQRVRSRLGTAPHFCRHSRVHLKKKRERTNRSLTY